MLAQASRSDRVTQCSERLAAVQAGIARAAREAGRADWPQLVAISKTFDADAIRPLIAAGQRHFGENRVQEAQAKWPALLAETPGITLHLVGQLQSNKAADAIALFDVIHAVDRPSLVTALAKAQTAAGKRPDCYLQVNIGDEPQKGGCALADLPNLLDQGRAAGSCGGVIPVCRRFAGEHSADQSRRRAPRNGARRLSSRPAQVVGRGADGR